MENAASILFEKTKADKKVKEELAKYKNVLLDILGDSATPVDVLYGTIEKPKKILKMKCLIMNLANYQVQKLVLKLKIKKNTIYNT